MQEIQFLVKNAPFWQKVESNINADDFNDADEIIDLYIRLTDDLSYARTFFPQSKTHIYLNSLTSLVHQKIYKKKKISRGRIREFWLKELPLLFYKHRKKLAISVLIFVASVTIGIVSSANDETFVRFVLGDKYVNMSLENIKNNDPLAIYKKMNEVEMFLGITFNNIRVSFFVFISGVLLSFGSALLLFQNGLMLGTFQYFFFQKGLLIQSFLSIWIHGTLEISAIIVAGASGFVLGNSFLFPGTFSRKESFIRGAYEGMKMVVGLIPVFVVAGFLEGFVTRYTSMPLSLNLTIILGSLLFVVYYFVFLPRKTYIEYSKAN